MKISISKRYPGITLSRPLKRNRKNYKDSDKEKSCFFDFGTDQ